MPGTENKHNHIPDPVLTDLIGRIDKQLARSGIDDATQAKLHRCKQLLAQLASAQTLCNAFAVAELDLALVNQDAIHTKIKNVQDRLRQANSLLAVIDRVKAVKSQFLHGLDTKIDNLVINKTAIEEYKNNVLALRQTIMQQMLDLERELKRPDYSAHEIKKVLTQLRTTKVQFDEQLSHLKKAICEHDREVLTTEQALYALERRYCDEVTRAHTTLKKPNALASTLKQQRAHLEQAHQATLAAIRDAKTALRVHIIRAHNYASQHRAANNDALAKCLADLNQDTANDTSTLFAAIHAYTIDAQCALRTYKPNKVAHALKVIDEKILRIPIGINNLKHLRKHVLEGNYATTYRHALTRLAAVRFPTYNKIHIAMIDHINWRDYHVDGEIDTSRIDRPLNVLISKANKKMKSLTKGKQVAENSSSSLVSTSHPDDPSSGVLPLTEEEGFKPTSTTPVRRRPRAASDLGPMRFHPVVPTRNMVTEVAMWAFKTKTLITRQQLQALIKLDSQTLDQDAGVVYRLGFFNQHRAVITLYHRLEQEYRKYQMAPTEPRL